MFCLAMSLIKVVCRAELKSTCQERREKPEERRRRDRGEKRKQREKLKKYVINIIFSLYSLCTSQQTCSELCQTFPVPSIIFSLLIISRQDSKSLKYWIRSFLFFAINASTIQRLCFYVRMYNVSLKLIR